MTWQTVALVLGIVWAVALMYVATVKYDKGKS
jgi:hypothetical protein